MIKEIYEGEIARAREMRERAEGRAREHGREWERERE